MTYNFNNIIDARGSQVGMLQRIYGQNGVLLWEKASQGGEDPSNYSTQYLTFKFLSSGTFSSNDATTNEPYIYISINNGNWQPMGVQTFNVNENDVVRVKSNVTNYTPKFYTSKALNYNIYGNIMSLFYGDDFSNKISFPSTNVTFEDWIMGYYENNTYHKDGVKDISNLILPATTLHPSCYLGMFSYFSSITTAPTLPATTLANHCYTGMFNHCTSLVHAPTLAATTLATSCYHEMFAGCTSLVHAPELLVTTLVGGCYGSMFRGCTNLRYIKCLATNASDSSLYAVTNWLYDASNTGTFIKASGSVWPTGNSGIPTGWTVQNA